MVRHLPPKEQKHALMYGLAGALIFRIIAIFLITILAQYWQIQVLGGLYLIYMAGVHIKEFFDKRKEVKEAKERLAPIEKVYNEAKEKTKVALNDPAWPKGVYWWTLKNMSDADFETFFASFSVFAPFVVT